MFRVITVAFVSATLIGSPELPLAEPKSPPSPNEAPGKAKPFSSSDQPPGESKENPAEPVLGPLTVGDVIVALHLDKEKLRFDHEPPGKLNGIQAVTTLRDSKIKVVVKIQIQGRPFREKWNAEVASALKVHKVIISTSYDDP
jgi:hypothetical protein